MKIPTPSFFKIRLVILAISFVVFCFVVGVVKDVLANDWTDAECKAVTSDISGCVQYTMSGNGNSNGYTAERDDTVPTINYTGGQYIASGNPYWYCTNSDRIYWYIWDAVNGEWEQYAGQKLSGIPFKVDPVILTKESDYASYSELPEECTNCDDEEQEAIAECGEGQWEWTDESNCEWECICPEDYIRWGDECVYCPSGEFEATTGNCIHYCPHGTNEKVGEYVIYNGSTCIVPPCGEGEYENSEGICRNNCPAGYAIDPSTGECTLNCSAGYEEFNGECVPSCPSGTVMDENGICRAGTDPLDPEPGVPEPDPSEPPPDQEPEPDTPDNPEDPSDEKLGAIHDELQKIVEQNNDRKDQLSEANDKLGWIGDNAEIIADNTADIGNAMNDLDDNIAAGVSEGVRDGFEDLGESIDDLGDALQGIEDGIEGLEDNLEGIGDTLDEINEGTYTSPDEEEEYGIPEHNFSDRTEEFFSNMKTTGLFSFPDQLSSSMPSGGISTMEIDGGETFGTHTIDFNDMSSAINILKYVIQIFCMTIAIRIITLKR